MQKRVALTNGIVVCMDKDRTILQDGHVLLEDNIIKVVSSDWKDVQQFNPTETIDVRGKIVFPGLINTHIHLRPVRGLGDGLGTWDWHVEYVDKISAAMTPEDAYLGAQLALAESIASGVTTVQGMTVYGEPEFAAAIDLGLRARLVPHAEDYPSLKEHMEKIIEQGGNEEDLVRFWLGMEITTLFNVEQLQEVRQCATATGTRIHTHYSEWEPETIAPLVESGFLGRDVSLAHCIHVGDKEISALAHNGVSISHNPKSNMKTGSGAAPIIKMREKNINVALGTDGPLCTYKLDLWEEIRAAAFLQRVIAGDATVLDAWDVLEMATINGAKAMGMEDSIGSIEVGKRADLIVIETANLHMVPLIVSGPHCNIAPILAFSVSGSDVIMVFVDGKQLYREGAFLGFNPDRIRAKVNTKIARILADL